MQQTLSIDTAMKQTMKSSLALACLACLLLAVASDEGIFKVNLSKKALKPERIAEQRQHVQEKLLNSLQKGAVDPVQLDDFMDAQVRLFDPPRRPVEICIDCTSASHIISAFMSRSATLRSY